MVSSISIVCIAIAAICSFLLPIIVFLYFKRKEKINLKPVVIGAIIFFVFTLILERSIHLVVIKNNLIENPVLFGIYGALMAGIFEETGRFIAFKTVLKKMHEWKDGLSYGIGHGGIEAILIGSISYIQYLYYSSIINNGSFNALSSKVTTAQFEQLNQIRDVLVQSSPGVFMLGMLERVFAFGIQLALTMVVLYAVRYRKNIYLFVAILLHALVDFPAGLYQSGIITSLFVIESITAVYFIIAVIFVHKTKKIFKKEASKAALNG